MIETREKEETKCGDNTFLFFFFPLLAFPFLANFSKLNSPPKGQVDPSLSSHVPFPACILVQQTDRAVEIDQDRRRGWIV